VQLSCTKEELAWMSGKPVCVTVLTRVPHPFGFWFIKGCGFRVSFMQGRTNIDSPHRPLRSAMTHIFLLLLVSQRSNPFSIVHLRRLISFERYHYNNSLDSKTIRAIMCYGLVVVRAGHLPLRSQDPPDCLHNSYLNPQKRHFLAHLFSISCALFCSRPFCNSFAIIFFRTLCKKHRGWVHPT